jgi:hypothetical protein
LAAAGGVEYRADVVAGPFDAWIQLMEAVEVL